MALAQRCNLRRVYRDIAYLFIHSEKWCAVKKETLKSKNLRNKKGKTLFKHSKEHTKAFAQQTKALAKNLTKEIKDFTKAMIEETKD
ncbi:hypothetical protein AO9_01115 [Chlamydia psittaci Mat116]|nr:hypothetical protein AO9_01115 [Chlamydia psittaci Mat116]